MGWHPNVPGMPDAVSTERCSTANLQPQALRPYRRHQYYVEKQTVQTAVCEICCLLLAVVCALLVNAASFILMFAFVHEILTILRHVAYRLAPIEFSR